MIWHRDLLFGRTAWYCRHFGSIGGEKQAQIIDQRVSQKVHLSINELVRAPRGTGRLWKSGDSPGLNIQPREMPAVLKYIEAGRQGI